MTEPKKTEPFLEDLAQAIFGKSRKDEACVSCGTDKVGWENFRDDKSQREFKLSRLCQKCQDTVFGVGA